MLYLSTDGGVSWQEKPDSSVAQLWTTYRILGMASASLVGDPTSDALHWEQLYALGVDAEGKGVVAFSGDVGETWADITDPEQALNDPRAIVAHQTLAGSSWVVSKQGVWETADFGFTWALNNRGLLDFTKFGSGALNALTNDLDGRLLLATSRGLYEKAPDASLWDKVGDTSYGDKNLVSLLLTESNPTLLWVNTENDGVFVYRIVND
jgi:ligand-binding sensor domain-containing protein